MRVVTISDIHVDLAENQVWLQALCESNPTDDILILAGDIGSGLATLEETLSRLRKVFQKLFFVPGNHDLWVQGETGLDSLDRFKQVQALCESLDVTTAPTQIKGRSGQAIWIVPLASWYVRPEEGPDSLFIEKPGEDPELKMWADRIYIKWPDWDNRQHAAEYFLAQNERQIDQPMNGTIISFSHFLPRGDLIFPAPEENDLPGAVAGDQHPEFNFSRVAGTSLLEQQIRKLGSTVHIHGHQHRNRDRVIDGVRYLSHCLGYLRERDRISMPSELIEPKLVMEI